MCSSTIAAGPRQRGHPRVRVPWDTRSYSASSDSVLPKEQTDSVVFILSHSQGYDGGIPTGLPVGSQLQLSYTTLRPAVCHQSLSWRQASWGSLPVPFATDPSLSLSLCHIVSDETMNLALMNIVGLCRVDVLHV